MTAFSQTFVTTVTPDITNGKEDGDVLIVKLPDGVSKMFIWDGTNWVQFSTPA